MLKEKGFVFTILIIALASVLLAYTYFQFSNTEILKEYKLDLLEARKVVYLVDNISQNIYAFTNMTAVKEYKDVNFNFNINLDKNFIKLQDLDDFYNNTFKNIVSGSLKLSTSSLRDNVFEIYFDNSYLEYDYVNKIVRVIPTKDLNYNIKLDSSSASSSKTVWTYSSGKYVTLNYSDSNYSYNNSGYINGTNACNTNKFTINYSTGKLTFEICKYNNINNTLIIDLDTTDLLASDLNLNIKQNEEIKSIYYNADLNYILKDSNYNGKIKIG